MYQYLSQNQLAKRKCDCQDTENNIVGKTHNFTLNDKFKSSITLDNNYRYVTLINSIFTNNED